MKSIQRGSKVLKVDFSTAEERRKKQWLVVAVVAKSFSTM